MMRKDNLKRLKYLLVTGGIGLSLVGCQAKGNTANYTEDVYDSYDENSNNDSYINEFEDDFNNSYVIDEEYQNDNYAYNDEYQEEVIYNESEEKFDYFEGAKNEIENLLLEERLSELLQKGKSIFVSGVDFLFYDKEIGGVTFDQLSENGKRRTIENLESIDRMICEYYPDYKEDFSRNYAIASNYVHEEYLEVLGKIREYLGDENYEAVGEIKDQIKGDLSEQKDKALSKIKSWYEDFRK